MHCRTTYNGHGGHGTILSVSVKLYSALYDSGITGNKCTILLRVQVYYSFKSTDKCTILTSVQRITSNSSSVTFAE